MVWSDESETSYTKDDYDPDKVEERPISVPTLQKIATLKVAIALWNRAIVAIPGFNTDHKKWRDSLHCEVFKWIETLPVPKLLAGYIKLHFRRVNQNMFSLIVHLGRFFKTVAENPQYYLPVNHIIWHSNGRINLVETVRIVLKADTLNNVQKYHLASAYCLREEIEKIWPMLTKIDRSIVGANKYFNLVPDGFLSSYWACLCNGESNKIRYSFRIVPRCILNWSTIGYFFDRLNTEQQVTEAGYLIKEFGLRFQHLVLMKLNESQRVSVLEENAIFIICNYAQSEDGEEYAISTWYEFRDFITQQHQLVDLFSKLLSYKTKESILTEIWNSAPDDFKQHNYDDNYDFIEKVLKWLTYYKYNESGLTFLSAVLLYTSNKREITKKPFFIECCLRLCGSNLKLLDGLLNLFLLDAAESIEFKQSLLRSPNFNEFCKTLINHRSFRRLVKLFDFGFSITDPSSTEFLREMLSENIKLLNDWCLKFYSDGMEIWNA